MSDLFLAVKSSLDRFMTDQVATLQDRFPDIQFVEVDDQVQVAEQLASEAPTLLYTVSNPSPSPRLPLFHLEFAVGVKTVQDKANYRMADLVTHLLEVIKPGYRMEIRDYSGVSGTPPLVATILVTSVAPDYPRFDRMAGVRLFGVSAKGCEVVA